MSHSGHSRTDPAIFTICVALGSSLCAAPASAELTVVQLSLDFLSHYTAADQTVSSVLPTGAFLSDGLFYPRRFIPSRGRPALSGDPSVVDGLLVARFSGGGPTIVRDFLGAQAYLEFQNRSMELVAELGARTGWIVGTAILTVDGLDPEDLHTILPIGSKVGFSVEVELQYGAEFRLEMFEADFWLEGVGKLDLTRPASRGFEEDCDANGILDAADIARNHASDCQLNWIDDACELDAGSNDCDANGIPDECDLDCDANNLPDACEIASDPERDCNLNEHLDVCDVSMVRTIQFQDDFSTATLDPAKWTQRNGVTIVSNTETALGPAVSLNLIDELISAPIDLSGSAIGTVSFVWQFPDSALFFGPDALYVEYWDGTSWRRLQHKLTGYILWRDWMPEVQILPKRALHSEFRLRFRAETDYRDRAWYVDNVIVSATSPDIDGNGVPDDCE